MAQVVIHNKRAQSIEAAVKDTNGKIVAVRLGPHEKSSPVDQASLTDYTWGLERRGHVKIRKA